MPAAPRHRFAAVLVALLQLAVSLGTAANLVFCSTASGHVAVESAFDADCCDRPPLTQTFGRGRADDDCGCIDTPLLQNPVEPRSKSTQLSAHFDAIVALPVDVATASLQHAAVPLQQALPPEQRLTARRSVVLLL